MEYEIPTCARTWGRIVDTSNLLPGDLVLTRLVNPDSISNYIVEAQKSGGFPPRHAQWTHAAVYLGDGEHICEANFKVAGLRAGVNIRSIFDYCDGQYALKVRRPIVTDERQRIGIAIEAVRRVNTGYSFSDLFHYWRAANSGHGFWRSPAHHIPFSTRPLLCSTLYQEVYATATTGTAIKLARFCTPAHLSSDRLFETSLPAINWLTLE